MALTSSLTSKVVRAGGYLVSEEETNRSRDAITVLSGSNLVAGHVIEAVLVGASASSAAAAGNVGNGVMGAVTASNAAKPGVYQVSIVEPAANAGEFEVIDPDGVISGTGTVAVAFSAGGLAFTLADGATDFTVGDRFYITVSGGGFKFREYNPANTDAAIAPAGILFDDVDATAADKAGAAHVRQCQVNAGELTWFAGASAGQITAALQAMKDRLGIVARTAV